MNKKLLMIMLSVFAIGLVVAGATYYAVFSFNVNVLQPISVNGEAIPTEIVLEDFDCNAGETCLGDAITVTNDGENPVVIAVDTASDLNVSYVGKLRLTKKDTTTWEPIGESTEITYTVIGDTLEVTGVPDEYVAVYYPNVGTEESYTGQVILVEDVDESLPIGMDVNKYSTLNTYCTSGFNPNATRCVGAKLWLIPEDSITYGYMDTIDWGRASEFYFETDLINYFHGEITIPAESYIEFYPQVSVSQYASGGPNLVEITIA